MAFYGVRKWTDAVFAVHQDAVDNRDLLEQLAGGRQTADGRPLSALRCLDIVVWHHERYGDGCYESQGRSVPAGHDTRGA
jgi:hypothetical protein